MGNFGRKLVLSAGVLAASLIVSARARGSATHTFSAQSLIIANKDICHNPTPYNNGWTPPPGYCPDPVPPASDGALKAYGAVYQLLAQGIPVFYVVDETKPSIDAVDMTITALVGTPVYLWDRTQPTPTGGTVEFMDPTHTSIDYRGAPFVIAASDAPAALTYIKSQSIFDTVNIHVAKQDFQAPVKAILQQTPPKIALVDLTVGGRPLGAIGVLTGYLTDAGLNTAGAFSVYPDTSGTVFVRFQNVSDFTSGGLTSSGIKIVWAPHWQGDAAPQSQADRDGVVQAISDFVDQGSPAFVECAGIATMEGATGGGPVTVADGAPGHFMTTGNALGLRDNQAPHPWPRNASESIWFNDQELGNPLIQIGDFRMVAGTGFVDDFTPNTAAGASYKPGVLRLVSTVKAPADPASYDAQDIYTVVRKDNDPTKGLIVYLAGHAYGSTGGGCSGTSCSFGPQTPMVAGEMMVLNTLLFFGQLPQEQELTRSSPIIMPDGTTFLGTYIAQTQPANAYPPWKGHFRQYPPGALQNTSVTAFATPVKDWDAADNIAAQAQRYASGDTTARNVFTAIPISGKPTHFAFTAANAAALQNPMGYITVQDTTAAINGVLGGGLGGVDHSTPAIIGPSPIAGSPNRPTVAYVGALDGMLHCILVSGTAGSARPGDELWAFVPRSQLSQIGSYAAGVDGSPQVGDVFIKGSDGNKHWRTVVVVTSNAFDLNNLDGTVSLIDITDPLNPTFLWDATNWTPDGAYVLGAAQGAAFAAIVPPSGNPTSAVFVATNNQGKAGNGVNVYALDAFDGSVIWRFSHTYVRHIPGATDLVPNDVPGVVAASSLTGDGSITERVYFGDIDGNLYALNAVDGSTTSQPLYTAGVDGQPIESGIALYRDTTTRNLSIVAVTGGADWVPMSNISAVVSVDVKNVGSTGASNVIKTLQLAAGERVYGAPSVGGNDAYMITSFGVLHGNIGTSSADPGYLRRLDLATFSITSSTQVTKGAGEVGMGQDGSLVAASAAGITQVLNSGRDAAGLALTGPGASPLKPRAWLDFR